MDLKDSCRGNMADQQAGQETLFLGPLPMSGLSVLPGEPGWVEGERWVRQPGPHYKENADRSNSSY